MPTVTQHTLFISDLHLSEANQDATTLFFQFLDSEAAQTADALYILGDFFELWVGDDDRCAFHEKIKSALRLYTQRGIPTFFMHGNRDFLIRKRFAKETGITLLPEPTIIQLYGEPILLLHGDSLCTADIRHQKTRKISLNRFYQNLVLWFLPLRVRRKIGQRFRNFSDHRKSSIESTIMDVTPETVIDEMSKAKVKRLIHGHTHRPAIHAIEVDGQPAQRIVLGDWHDYADYLLVDSHRNMTLKRICVGIS